MTKGWATFSKSSSQDLCLVVNDCHHHQEVHARFLHAHPMMFACLSRSICEKWLSWSSCWHAPPHHVFLRSELTALRVLSRSFISHQHAFRFMYVHAPAMPHIYWHHPYHANSHVLPSHRACTTETKTTELPLDPGRCCLSYIRRYTRVCTLALPVRAHGQNMMQTGRCTRCTGY